MAATILFTVLLVTVSSLEVNGLSGRIIRSSDLGEPLLENLEEVPILGLHPATGNQVASRFPFLRLIPPRNAEQGYPIPIQIKRNAKAVRPLLLVDVIDYVSKSKQKEVRGPCPKCFRESYRFREIR